MSFFEMLSTLLIGPLKLVFEIIFVVANRFINHPGLSIIVLSLIMNLLVLPLYKRADAMQEAARDTEEKLHKGVAHIKKTFSGDERMMILQAYYRQNNYKPTDALNGSVSLLLEIPFFMAAYQFLSSLELLKGVSLGPIADLSKPDGLLAIGGITLNLLPIIMTLVNVISSAIYLKGFPAKTKIQLYAMALFFLVFLYTSPSGLVFYWTLNNIFSLCKTIFYKLKNAKEIINTFLSVVGLGAIFSGVFIYSGSSLKIRMVLILAGLAVQYPTVSYFAAKHTKDKKTEKTVEPNRKLFWICSALLTVIVGAFIPSVFIAASPQEYITINNFSSPLWNIVNSTCLSAGTFLVWMGVFYWLASPKGKVIFERILSVLCVIMLVNYMFFGTELGVISSKLQYEYGVAFTLKEQLLNLLILAVIACVVYFITVKWNKVVVTAFLTVCIAVGGMSVYNIYKSYGPIQEAKKQTEVLAESMPSFELSKNGNNVIVLMLDRALGEMVPYIMNEKPELKEQFDGFSYYSNALSYGGYTNFATPSLFGGYEYTPVEMNKRDTESLMSKHNEALKVMPVLFSENGYDVTVCDPTYANYSWIPDLSVFDDYPEIQTYLTKGKFENSEEKEKSIKDVRRNFFCFSIMKTMPLSLQGIIYNEGNYNQAISSYGSLSTQTMTSVSTAEGTNASFMEYYNVLTNLTEITKITEEEKNTFMMMSNDSTHEPALLQTPDYVPSSHVDNSEYDAANADRFTVDGVTLNIENTYQMSHYHVNMATFLQLGKWFDWMRENGVYDNTRIIIVSDHGRDVHCLESMDSDDGDDIIYDLEFYFPLLMVKDFNSEGYSVSDEFMTNADVPTIATSGIIEDPVNPFTGNLINNSEKTAHDQFVIMSTIFDTEVNNGNTYISSVWGSVEPNTNPRDKENWTFATQKTVLKDYIMP